MPLPPSPASFGHYKRSGEHPFCLLVLLEGIHGKLEMKAAAGFFFTLFLFLVNREEMEEAKKKAMVLLCLVVLSGGFCCVSAASPARLVSAFVSNLLSALLRRLWSLTPSTRNGSIPYHSTVSPEGYTGHVDGKPRAARMNHPKGLAVDDKGNIYVADTKNKAIRKVSDTGVTTIAGGKLNKGGHVDGPSEDATFSSDFEVVYIGSSCSLLVVDRGNQAIREIQLHFDDCAYQYGTGFPLGRASIIDPTSPTEASYLSSPYQQPLKSSLRPLIPPEAEYEKHEEEEGLFTSVKKLVTGAGLSLSLLFSGIFLRKMSQSYHQDQQKQQHKANSWPLQESFIVPDEEPPPLEVQTPNQQRKTYAFMSKNPEKLQQLRYDRAYINGWDGESQLQQRHLQKHRQLSSSPRTYYEPTYETTDEVVFGAVQESDSKYDMSPSYDQYGPRYRVNY
ncbi:hypothetical protein B296_00000380 [Ensete ventricosum]|uniref:NHL repeat-containing protein n=1 Tax=Ensete ventricosum TaxID=4639 RepID=A0A427BC12_ENSVE|nr:hypothetical protein B296_00000380 [Ensete ventricosum]